MIKYDECDVEKICLIYKPTVSSVFKKENIWSLYVTVNCTEKKIHRKVVFFCLPQKNEIYRDQDSCTSARKVSNYLTFLILLKNVGFMINQGLGNFLLED